jgi:hypothetical protein
MVLLNRRATGIVVRAFQLTAGLPNSDMVLSGQLGIKTVEAP